MSDFIKISDNKKKLRRCMCLVHRQFEFPKKNIFIFRIEIFELIRFRRILKWDFFLISADSDSEETFKTHPYQPELTSG